MTGASIRCDVLKSGSSGISHPDNNIPKTIKNEKIILRIVGFLLFVIYDPEKIASLILTYRLKSSKALTEFTLGCFKKFYVYNSLTVNTSECQTN
jgi:hypothetical protein